MTHLRDLSVVVGIAVVMILAFPIAVVKLLTDGIGIIGQWYLDRTLSACEGLRAWGRR